MTQDTVNEAQAIRNIAQALENKLIVSESKVDEVKEKLDDALNRIIELRQLIDRMVEDVPSLNRKFKEEIDRLND